MQVDNLKIRLVAVIALLIGLFCVYWGIFLPYTAVSEGAATASMSWKGVMCGPLISMFALVYLVLGQRALPLFGPPASNKGALLSLLIVGLSILPIIWLQHQFRLHGYY